MTDVLLALIALMLFLIWRELPVRRLSEQVLVRAVKVLEAVIKEKTNERED